MKTKLTTILLAALIVAPLAANAGRLSAHEWAEFDRHTQQQQANRQQAQAAHEQQKLMQEANRIQREQLRQMERDARRANDDCQFGCYY